MTLKSAFEDLKSTTLAAVSGLLGKLTYIASLRRQQGRYEHWGMETVHGTESSDRALRSAHAEILSGVLRTPIATLLADLRESSVNSGFDEGQYVENMHAQFEDLLPSDRKDTPSASHLNSVLAALSSLQKSRGRSTRSTS